MQYGQQQNHPTPPSGNEPYPQPEKANIIMAPHILGRHDVDEQYRYFLLVMCRIHPPGTSPKKEKEKALNKQGLIKKNTGRHDWTRTNDPHHVKVVL